MQWGFGSLWRFVKKALDFDVYFQLEEFNINKIIERFKNKKRVRIIVFGSLHFVGYVRDKLCPQQKD